jgi:hypothetical protein
VTKLRNKNVNVLFTKSILLCLILNTLKKTAFGRTDCFQS